MKKPFSWIVLLCLFGTATFQQCTDDSESAAPEKVQFTCSFTADGSDGGRAQAAEIPDALLLSLTNTSGEPVFLHKRVTLLRIGESFITEPMELAPGQYKITDFMLVADDNTVIYASPQKGSPLAKAVNRPLPFQFSVAKNKVSNINMEVIDINGRLPEDFGYASFFINPVNPLQVSVFIPHGNGTTLASAKAWIVEGNDTIKQYNLGATINLISFPGDPDVSRKLIVERLGYDVVVKDFVYTDLIATLDGLPWKITLVPSVFTLIPRYTHFELTLEGAPGTFVVDWGDGTSGAYNLVPHGVLIEHNYGSVGTYQVAITGDLEKIEYLENTEYIGAMNEINLRSLSGLRRMRIAYTECPAVIDLSNNYRFGYLIMPVALQLKTIILPQNSVIQYLDVNGPNQMTTADVDNLIDQVYAGAVANRVPGTFFMYNTQNMPDSGLLGPPSPDRIDKLRELRDTYSWFIRPNTL
jgi:hypothetical protein